MMREVKFKEVAVPLHPMAATGGHAGPTIGRVGAAKGLTDVSGGAAGGSRVGAGQIALKAAAEAAKVRGSIRVS